MRMCTLHKICKLATENLLQYNISLLKTKQAVLNKTNLGNLNKIKGIIF